MHLFHKNSQKQAEDTFLLDGSSLQDRSGTVLLSGAIPVSEGVQADRIQAWN